MTLQASTTPQPGRKRTFPSIPPSQKEITDYLPLVQQAKQDQSSVMHNSTDTKERQSQRTEELTAGKREWEESMWKILPFHGSSDVPVITLQMWPWNAFLCSCFYFVALHCQLWKLVCYSRDLALLRSAFLHIGMEATKFTSTFGEP